MSETTREAKYAKVMNLAAHRYQSEAWAADSGHGWDRLHAIASEYARGDRDWRSARALVAETQSEVTSAFQAPQATAPEATTATVDVVIRLEVTGTAGELASHLDALHNLADVMAVQAEDGLWTLGAPDLETDDGPSAYVTDIATARVQAILIEGLPEGTTGGGRR